MVDEFTHSLSLRSRFLCKWLLFSSDFTDVTEALVAIVVVANATRQRGLSRNACSSIVKINTKLWCNLCNYITLFAVVIHPFASEIDKSFPRFIIEHDEVTFCCRIYVHKAKFWRKCTIRRRTAIRGRRHLWFTVQWHGDRDWVILWNYVINFTERQIR